MAKCTVLSPIHFVTIVKRRLATKNRQKAAALRAYEKQCEIIQQVNETESTISGMAKSQADLCATKSFDNSENAFIENVEEASCDGPRCGLPTTTSHSTITSVYRRNRRRPSSGFLFNCRFRTLPMCRRNLKNSFWPSRKRGVCARSNNNSFAKKKERTLKRVTLLVTLLPLLQETLSLFDDLYCTAINCASKVETVISSMTNCIPSHIAFMLTVVAIIKFEVVLEYLFCGSILALWLHPPRIFGTPCHLRRLPAISARMCQVFQGSVRGAMIFLSLLSFHGGVSSLVIWATFVIVCSAVQVVGFSWTMKLACAGILILYNRRTDWCRQFSLHCVQALQRVPGIEFYRTKIAS